MSVNRLVRLLNTESTYSYWVEAKYLYCYPDCQSCLAHLDSIGWATLAIWTIKKYNESFVLFNDCWSCSFAVMYQGQSDFRPVRDQCKSFTGLRVTGFANHYICACSWSHERPFSVIHITKSHIRPEVKGTLAWWLQMATFFLRFAWVCTSSNTHFYHPWVSYSYKTWHFTMT